MDMDDFQLQLIPYLYFSNEMQPFLRIYNMSWMP